MAHATKQGTGVPGRGIVRTEGPAALEPYTE